MKKTSLTGMLLLFLSCFTSAQSDSTISNQKVKDILSGINFNSVKILSDYAAKACKCIDSIDIRKKDDKQIATAISECIDRQTILYESIIEMSMALKNGNQKIEINVDKESRKYKEYYFKLEEWLSDSCPSLKHAVKSSNVESELSVSKDSKALEQYNKGIDFLKVENYKDALPWFEKAVITDPNFAFAWDNIGVCSRRLENYDRALEAYRKSLELDPKGKTPLQNIPVVYQYKNDYDKAIEGYNKLLEVYPEDPEGYFGIGRMYILKSDLEKGLDNMCKAYNLYIKMNSPYRVDAKTIIVSIYSEMKKNGQEDLFNTILKNNNISTK